VLGTVDPGAASGILEDGEVDIGTDSFVLNPSNFLGNSEVQPPCRITNRPGGPLNFTIAID